MDSNLYEEKSSYHGDVEVSWVDYHGYSDQDNLEADAPPKTYPEIEQKLTEDPKVPELEKLSLGVDTHISHNLPITDPEKYSEQDNNNVNNAERAIDREIRLAQEREEELKKEFLARTQDQSSTMPIHKVPDLVYVDKGPVMSKAKGPPALTSPKTTSATLYKELPEVDRDSAIIKRESIIEREIREQQEREMALRLEITSKQDKEAEQSEFERREKEHERQAHESLMDREIRQQKQREQEIVTLHRSVSSTPTSIPDITPSHSPAPPVTMTSTSIQEPQYDVEYNVQTTTTTHTDAVQPLVTYEDAIKTKSHEGESIIARELREQREREEELRKRYTDMGLEKLLARQEPPDTPFNRPEPAQPDITKLPARAKTNIKTGKMTKSVSEPIQIAPPRAVKREINTEPVRVTSSVSQDAISVQQPAPVPEETAGIEDATDGFDHSYRFVPQHETPIEREMRLAREREEELRQARGFPKASSNQEAVVEIQKIAQPASRPPTTYKKGDEGDGKVHQKFAASRLQHEIQMEKRREQDLKSQGMINTLSEERVSGPTKYVDVIPRASVDVKVTPNWKTQTAVTTVQGTASPVGSTAPAHDATDAGGASLTANARNSSPAPPHQEAAPSRQQKPEPAIVQRYSSHTKQLVNTDNTRYRDRPSPTIAESRIEQELREMREREEELRSLRRSFTDLKSPTNGDLRANFEMPSNGLEGQQTRTSSTSSETAKTRRKSAMAEEWEKKFGAK